MASYQATIQKDGEKSKVIKNAPSATEAEDSILNDNPGAVILDIGRIANVGENQQMLPRDYK